MGPLSGSIMLPDNFLMQSKVEAWIEEAKNLPRLILYLTIQHILLEQACASTPSPALFLPALQDC
jgi:hypothetical protein